jgi:hypothetical protein
LAAFGQLHFRPSAGSAHRSSTPRRIPRRSNARGSRGPKLRAAQDDDESRFARASSGGVGQAGTDQSTLSFRAASAGSYSLPLEHGSSRGVWDSRPRYHAALGHRGTRQRVELHVADPRSEARSPRCTPTPGPRRAPAPAPSLPELPPRCRKNETTRRRSWKNQKQRAAVSLLELPPRPGNDQADRGKDHGRLLSRRVIASTPKNFHRAPVR